MVHNGPQVYTVQCSMFIHILGVHSYASLKGHRMHKSKRKCGRPSLKSLAWLSLRFRKNMLRTQRNPEKRVFESQSITAPMWMMYCIAFYLKTCSSMGFGYCNDISVEFTRI